MKQMTTVTVMIMSFMNKCTVLILFLFTCCGFSQSYKFVSNNVYKDNIRKEHVKKRYTYAHDNTTNSKKLIEEIEFNENGRPVYIHKANDYEYATNYKYDNDGLQLVSEACDIPGDWFKEFQDKVPGFYGYYLPFIPTSGSYTIDYIRKNGVLKRKKITQHYRSKGQKASESYTINYEVEDFKVKAGYITEQQEKKTV